MGKMQSRYQQRLGTVAEVVRQAELVRQADAEQHEIASWRFELVCHVL